jgi:hypothetical protein
VKAPTVIAFPTDRQTPASNDAHPVVKCVTEVMVSLGNLAHQIEKWPMEPDAKLRMLNTIKSLALQACELQLAAVAEVTDRDRFRADLDGVMSALRLPES